MNKTLLNAKNLHKSFRSLPIIKGVDLSVQTGETLAIVGRSGEGKTTLLHLLGTLDTPTKGSIQILDQSVSFWNRSRLRSQHLGFIFQAFYLLEDNTVLENVQMPLKIARKPVSNKVLELIDFVGLSHRIYFPAKQLSGGEKQRVAIARALVNDPDLILADEPTGNLDPITRDPIHKLLFSYVEEHNKSLIVVTHDETLAQKCSRKYRLEEGRLTPS